MADSSLAPVDRQMAVRPSLSVYGTKVQFQFPPKITSESNNWNVKLSKDLQSYGPLKVLAGMGGRTINVEWEYIATDKIFNGAFIAATLRNLKKYFYEFRAAGSKQNAVHPVVSFQYGAIVPSAVNFRMMNMTITYGIELVIQNSDLFPLYTKVAIVLEMATTLGISSGPDKLLVPDLRKVDKQWY